MDAGTLDKTSGFSMFSVSPYVIVKIRLPPANLFLEGAARSKEPEANLRPKYHTVPWP